MNKTALAKRINVTRQTLNNWETSKPELIRLIKLGLGADKQYLHFLQLFPGNGDIFAFLHDFYIDFYFKFLSYYRQNITKPNRRTVSAKTNVFATFSIYFMQKDRQSIFDPTLRVSDQDLAKFAREDFKKPICTPDNYLSEYIMRNTLDDFETLLRDIVLNDEDNEIFLNALYIALFYLIYKFESEKTFAAKNKIFTKILRKEFDFDIVQREQTNKIDKLKILEQFLIFRKKYTLKHIDVISEELTRYRSNNFYVPDFIKDLET